MKEVCKKCQYWTENSKHGNYKCYTGNCPAKLRDEKGKPVYQRGVRSKHWKTIYSASFNGETPEDNVESLLQRTKTACILFTKDNVVFRVTTKIEILE